MDPPAINRGVFGGGKREMLDYMPVSTVFIGSSGRPERAEYRITTVKLKTAMGES